jgi:beta-galactosidase
MNYYPPRMPEFMQDYYRGGKNLIVLEQMSRLQPFDSGPGWMRLWAYRSLGHGALGTIFFRWRTCRWGQEQFADGILSHDGLENRRYGELAQMGAEMKQVADLIDGTSVPSEAAIALSYESRWAMEQERFGPEMDGLADAVRFHEAFLDANTPVDGLDPRADLSRYKLVIASRLFLVDEAITANLAKFVEAGGTLCLTAGSGAVDACGVGFDTPRPGPLAAMAGVTVSDLSPLHGPITLASETVPGLSAGTAHILSDEMHPKGAEVVATYAAGWRDGLPVLTVNAYGKGKVFYLGTALDEKATAALLDYLLEQAGVQRGPQTPEGVRAHERRGPEARLLFLLNYSDSVQTVTLAERWTDAFDGAVGEVFEVPPVGLRLLKRSL